MNIEWWNIIFLFLPFIGYAEIHYRAAGLPSLLFKREPEILFDLPHRTQSGQPVPLFLIVKDSHLYPVELLEAEVVISSETGNFTEAKKEIYKKKIQQKYFSTIIFLPEENFPDTGEYRVTARLRYIDRRGRQKILLQDNYSGIPHLPFRIRISSEPIPSAENWHWGDLHVHSLYTDDQVEFGASPEDTLLAARACGLKFLAVTDHSYDLDDEMDNYLKNDSGLTKWSRFHSEIKHLQEKYPDFCLIAGEEVSAGNHFGQNIHCLILNDSRYYPGSGDSAESLWNRKPVLPVPDLLSQRSAGSVAVAAHPLENPPLSQKIILNRGIWHWEDLSNSNLNLIQLMNRLNDSFFEKTRAIWIKLLLSGYKTGIAGGNDAHGNFNTFRQISIPFIRMNYSREHLLGQVRTAVFTEKPDPAGLMNGIRANRTIVSTGPFALFDIRGKEKGGIGDSVKFDEKMVVSVTAKSTPEYGKINEISLFYGNCQEGKEIHQKVPVRNTGMDFSAQLPLYHAGADYIRLEVKSRNIDMEYICLTSPVWIIRERS